MEKKFCFMYHKDCNKAMCMAWDESNEECTIVAAFSSQLQIPRELSEIREILEGIKLHILPCDY